MEVILKSISTIVPAVPTPSVGRYFLSNLDQIFAEDEYMNGVWYYKPSMIIKDHSNFFDALKKSLSQVLVHYPILAGRITQGDGRLEVDLNDNGVIFREATTNARFDDWNDIKDCTIQAKLNPEDIVISSYDSSPLIRFQITIFQCGGVSLGASNIHVIQDSWSLTEFLQSWSEVHLGLPISTPPVFASHLLKARDPPQISRAINGYVSHSRSNLINYGDLVFEAGEYQAKSYRFSAKEVEGIMKEIDSGPWKLERKVSSFVAMAAFSWKVMTEARELPDSTLTRYIYPISYKKRWEPQLPRGYFGNTVHLSSISANAGDIKKNHLSYTAKLLADDIERMNDMEFLKSVIDWIEVELGKDRVIGFDCDYYAGTDVQGTSMVNISLLQVDFGWGNALHVSFTFEPVRGDGHAFIFPSPHGGRSCLVHFHMRSSALKKLPNTSLFLRFQNSV